MIGQQSETRRKFLKLGGAALAGSLWTFGPHSAAAAGLHGHGPDIQPWTSSNPALSGAFEPVFDERDDADLNVEGEIPRGLRGVFMRNGPIHNTNRTIIMPIRSMALGWFMPSTSKTGAHVIAIAGS